MIELLDMPFGEVKKIMKRYAAGLSRFLKSMKRRK